MNKQQFKIGDLVIIKGDAVGPVMKITGFNPKDSSMAQCTWNEGRRVRNKYYHVDALEIFVQPPPPEGFSYDEFMGS